MNGGHIIIKYPTGVLVSQFYQFLCVFTGVEEITMSANRDAVNKLLENRK